MRRSAAPVPVFLNEGAVDLGGLLEDITEGFALHEMVLDARGVAIDYRFLSVNRAFESITGLRAEQVVGRTAGEVFEAPDPSTLARYGDVARTGAPARFVQHTAVMDIAWEVAAYRPAPGMVACLIADSRSESVAQIAGGTAHQINNMLTPVLGYADLLSDDPALPEVLRPFVVEIRRAAEKARELTSQLLAVSRGRSPAR